MTPESLTARLRRWFKCVWGKFFKRQTVRDQPTPTCGPSIDKPKPTGNLGSGAATPPGRESGDPPPGLNSTDEDAEDRNGEDDARCAADESESRESPPTVADSQDAVSTSEPGREEEVIGTGPVTNPPAVPANGGEVDSGPKPEVPSADSAAAIEQPAQGYPAPSPAEPNGSASAEVGADPHRSRTIVALSPSAPNSRASAPRLQPQSEGHRQRREPWRFGARRHDGASAGRGRHTEHPRPPELRCRQEGLEWTICLRVPSELGVTGVQLDGRDLSENNGEYQLPRYRGTLALRNGGGDNRKIALYDGQTPIIFRLSLSEGEIKGRQCGRITAGHFLVIAPAQDRPRYRVIQEDEPCIDPKFRAHHVHASGSETADDLGSIGNYRLGVDRTALLRGTTLYDSSDEGALFVGAMPELKPDKSIEWARVGEERPGGWKGQNFLANVESLAKVLGARTGRFFLRTYRVGSTALADSIAFRYWPDLREIKVDGQPFRDDLVLIPPADGTKSTTVQLVGEHGPLVPEILSKSYARLNRGAVVVDATRAGDEVRLRDAKQQVNVVVRLPRIWWRLARSAAWVDRPIEITRTEFRRPEEGLEVLIPVGTQRLSVGMDGEYRTFEAHGDQRFPNRRIVSVPFSSFVDYTVLRDGADRGFPLQVRAPDGEATRVDVLKVLPDKSLDASRDTVTASPVRLIRWETPEVRQGTIKIHKIGRIQGVRSRVAVFSRDAGIDAVATCHGPQDTRIHAVERELDGEKVELISWDKSLEKLVINAVSPAPVLRMRTDPATSKLIVTLPEGEFRGTDGRPTENVTLARQILAGLRVVFEGDRPFGAPRDERPKASYAR